MNLTDEKKFQLLQQISQEIRDTLDLDEILNRFLDMIKAVIDYDAAGVFVLNQDLVHARHETPQELIASVVWRGFDNHRPPKADPMLSQGKGIIGHVINSGEAVVVSDVRQDPRYVEGRRGTLSEIAVPIERNNQSFGALNLESDELGAYDAEDIEVLCFFADAAAIAIEKAMLHRQILEREQIEIQLKMAQNIQSRLLPDEPPVLPGYDIAGTCIPTFEIGGDYYDYIALPHNQWGFVMADVSGEGIPAALIMTVFRALLRTQIRTRSRTAVIAREMNQLLPDFSGGIDFVTAIIGILNPASGEFSYTNCGHNPPLLLRQNGRVDLLPKDGPLLGVVNNAGFKSATTTLMPGDLLLLYTDGIVEVMSHIGEEFGLERLLQVLQKNQTLPAAQIINEVILATQRFSEAPAFRDDVTLTVVQRKPRPSAV